MARPAGRPARRPRRGLALIRLLEAGAPAPDFDLAGSDGRRHRLRRMLDESYVLLVFYPGNDTPG